ncbi:tyrosine-type recombinase/integrase [Denitrobaculum tricleocarpae]
MRGREVARADNTRSYHKHLCGHFGKLRPDQITSVHVHAYWKLREKRPAALRDELIELRTTLKFALDSGWINRVPRIDIPAKRPPRYRFITREEAASLLYAADLPHLRAFILIAMTTGARKGAILGLTWDRVDLENCRIDFHDPERRMTKKRRTVVPIATTTAEALEYLRRCAQTPFVIEFLGKPVKDVKKSFQRACESAKLKNVTPHTLKHSVISWLAMDGFTVDEISDMTATTRETIITVYRKFDPGYLAPVAKSLAPPEGIANQFAKLSQEPESQKRQNSQGSHAFLVGERGFEPPAPTSRT